MMANLPYAVPLLAAVLYASLSNERAAAVGTVMMAGWLLYIAAWWEYSPAAIFSMSGVYIDHQDAWAITDMLVAIYVVLKANGTRWACALFWILVLQVAFHCFYKYAGLSAGLYETALNTTFLAQVAALFMAGGRKSADRLFDIFAHSRHVLRKAWPASGEKRAA